MKATLKRADAAAIRTSDARASASPPPDAAPLTAAMTGWRSPRSRGTSVAICCWPAIPACRPAAASLGCRGALGRLLQVEAGAEAPAGAGEHDHPHRAGRRRSRRATCVEVGDQLGAHGVEPVGPVEGEERDARFGVGAQRRCRSRRQPRTAGPAGSFGRPLLTEAVGNVCIRPVTEEARNVVAHVAGRELPPEDIVVKPHRGRRPGRGRCGSSSSWSGLVPVRDRPRA